MTSWRNKVKIVSGLVLGCVLVWTMANYLFHGIWTDFYFDQEGVAAVAIDRFFSENFRFFSIPHIQWHNDVFLYPYGIDSTFLFWALESNFCAWLSKRLSVGVFSFQVYHVLSLLVTLFGAYALIARRKGPIWGMIFAFLLTFCNYAAVGKFPVHCSHCIVHWVILSILTDVIAVEKYWNGEKFSARFLLLKVFLLVACLGLELGNIAGLAFCSVFITGCYIVLVQCLRDRSIRKTAHWFADVVRHFIRTYRQSWWNSVLTAAIIVFAWVYVPIVLQIMSNTPKQEATYVWRTNPLKVFIPIFPCCNPLSYMDGATSNVIFAWNCGLSLLFAFVLGLTRNIRSNFRKWLPFVIYLLLLVLFSQIPVLRHFPAFKYVRNPEQFSSYAIIAFLIPVYFACTRLSARDLIHYCREKEFLILLVPLFAVEMLTAYGRCLAWRTNFPLMPIPADYRNAVAAVKALPGEALFFLPFSAHGGDGNGMTKYHYLTAHQMQFAAMCGKKMNGCYLGRMFPDRYLQDFNLLDWSGYIGSRRWSGQRWGGLEDFFKASDFCAIVLGTNFVSAAQRDDIIARIGRPVAAFDCFGKTYEVIPLPGHLRGKKDLSAIRAIPPIQEELGEAETMFATEGGTLRLMAGFSHVEAWGVWGNATNSVLAVSLPKSRRPLRIAVKAQAYLKLSAVAVFCDNDFVGQWKISGQPMVPNEHIVEIPVCHTGKAVRLRFEQHDVVSPHELDPANGDMRTLGLGFISMRLLPAQEAKAE